MTAVRKEGRALVEPLGRWRGSEREVGPGLGGNKLVPLAVYDCASGFFSRKTLDHAA